MRIVDISRHDLVGNHTREISMLDSHRVYNARCKNVHTEACIPAEGCILTYIARLKVFSCRFRLSR
jgi:hypothetical protein